MLERLRKAKEGEKDMLKLINVCTSAPSLVTVHDLTEQIESIQKMMEEVGPRV